MILDFHHFGGTHWETAALKNALAFAGVTAPHTGKPLSEAMCLGIAGGIAAGYSFCPSIPSWQCKFEADPKLAAKYMQAAGTGPDGGPSLEARYIKQFNSGSGVSIVGRHHGFSTGADKFDVPLKRLGCTTTIKETAGIKAAQQHLTDLLGAGRPVFLWLAALKVTSLGWAGTCGMYSSLCFGINETRSEAYLADVGPDAVTLSLEELAFLRNRVCSFKNRALGFEPPAKLDEATLKKAVTDGIRACAGDFIKPKLGTFNLPGLLEWSKVIANVKNKKGWPVVYGGGKKGGELGGAAGGRLFAPLRDAFASIESAGTGGGLMRPLYAGFLDEAAALLATPALKACAANYRQLAAQWTDLAEACLPDRVKLFKQVKALIRKQDALLRDKGSKGEAAIAKAAAELKAIEADMREEFPLGAADTMALLEGLSAKIVALHAAETAAAKELAAM